MHVTLLAAQSLDGFITRHDLPGSGFASAGDQAHFRAALAGFDCSVVGGKTFRVAREPILAGLTARRLRIVLTRTPPRHAADARPDMLEFSDAAPEKILTGLAARGRSRCALLGGAQIHSLFLAARLVNELWLTVEPVLFGGGTPLLAARTDTRLELMSSETLNSTGTLLLRYAVIR